MVGTLVFKTKNQTSYIHQSEDSEDMYLLLLSFEQFLQGKIPLKHLLNEKILIMSLQIFFLSKK